MPIACACDKPLMRWAFRERIKGEAPTRAITLHALAAGGNYRMMHCCTYLDATRPTMGTSMQWQQGAVEEGNKDGAIKYDPASFASDLKVRY